MFECNRWSVVSRYNLEVRGKNCKKIHIYMSWSQNCRTSVQTSLSSIIINPLVTNINASTLETKHRLIFVIEQKQFRLTYNTTANIEHWWVGIGPQRNMIGWQHSSCTFVKLHLVFDLSNKIKKLSYTCILHIPVKITNKWSSNYFIFKFICFLKMLNSQKIKFWN